MVERFNGRISELIRQTHFASAAELEATLQNYWKLYNHHIPQRAIDGNTSIQALKEWQQKSLIYLLNGFMTERNLTI
jgi:uncharacterized membrane-anchored protein YhcB (DUF1043 family)